VADVAMANGVAISLRVHCEWVFNDCSGLDARSGVLTIEQNSRQLGARQCFTIQPITHLQPTREPVTTTTTIIINTITTTTTSKVPKTETNRYAKSSLPLCSNILRKCICRLLTFSIVVGLIFIVRVSDDSIVFSIVASWFLSVFLSVTKTTHEPANSAW